MLQFQKLKLVNTSQLQNDVYNIIGDIYNLRLAVTNWSDS